MEKTIQNRVVSPENWLTARQQFLGKIHLLEENHNKARAFFLKTLEQASLPGEKDFIRRMMEKLRDK